MTPTKPLIVAGATGYGVWPDNSLEGARQCLAAPVDGIEIDVQMTADGRVVAHHDYWLKPDATRLEGRWLDSRGQPLKTLTLDALRPYDVGALRPGSDYAARYPHRQPLDGVAIPTLEDLLGLLKAAPGPRRLFYIEIKTDPQDPGAAPDPDTVTNAVMDAVEAAGYADHTKIIAFDWSVLRRVRARAPTMATAHLTIPAALAIRVKPGPDGRSPWTDGVDVRDHGGSDLKAIKAHGGMEWSPYYTDVNEQTVAEALALDLKVGPWGLSKHTDIQRMAALGVFSSTVSGPDWG